MYDQISANKRKTAWLVTIFIIIIVLIGYSVGTYYEAGYFGIAFAVIIASAMSLTSYYSGDKIALFTAGARGPIQKTDNAYVYRLVENLCITAGIKIPKIYIIQDSALNAFACGRDPEHASIALTTGIIEKLENEELEGVIAHELSHIKNFDIRLMTIVIVLVGIVTLLADIFLRFGFWRGGKKNNAGGMIAIVGLILLILSPIFAKLIQLAISRKREYLADASGALLTRYPQGLAAALKKINHNSRISSHNKATAHLYIANPLAKNKLSSFLSTHPPIEKRIAALEAMS